jgi:hypothetical protein
MGKVQKPCDSENILTKPTVFVLNISDAISIFLYTMTLIWTLCDGNDFEGLNAHAKTCRTGSWWAFALCFRCWWKWSYIVTKWKPVWHSTDKSVTARKYILIHTEHLSKFYREVKLTGGVTEETETQWPRIHIALQHTGKKRRERMRFWWENQKERDYYENWGVGGMIILKLILQKHYCLENWD